MTKKISNHEQLLPGVHRAQQSNPGRANDFRETITRARGDANRRDLIDVLLLLLVDLLFVTWEQATVPFASRDVTVSLLLLLHAFVAASVFASRILPSLTAKRTAWTWHSAERQRIRL